MTAYVAILTQVCPSSALRQQQAKVGKKQAQAEMAILQHTVAILKHSGQQSGVNYEVQNQTGHRHTL